MFKLIIGLLITGTLIIGVVGGYFIGVVQSGVFSEKTQYRASEGTITTIYEDGSYVGCFKWGKCND